MMFFINAFWEFADLYRFLIIVFMVNDQDCEIIVVTEFWLYLFQRNLPRHQFGNLQSKMFPAYFSMVGVCCAVAVGAFGYLHPWKTSGATEKYQLGFLLAAFGFNLSNLVIFTPMTIEVLTSFV